MISRYQIVNSELCITVSWFCRRNELVFCVTSGSICHGLPCNHTDRHDGICNGKSTGTVCSAGVHFLSHTLSHVGLSIVVRTLIDIMNSLVPSLNHNHHNRDSKLSLKTFPLLPMGSLPMTDRSFVNLFVRKRERQRESRARRDLWINALLQLYNEATVHNT